MKKYLLAFILLLAMGAAFAQTKPKPKVKPPIQKEKPPTQKEMGDMMKEMQQALDEMSPEDKKAMEDIGVTLPSTKNVPVFTDQQLQDGANQSENIVPEKDSERITGMSKIPLTNSTLPAFLQSVHVQLVKELDPYIIESGDKIYHWAKNEYHSTTAIGNMATGFWMMGKPPIALYLMSQACKDDTADADNLNNFSALLLMAGAEQLAIPILNKLNRQFPKNSTILNNIGQAWFGLGEIDKAEKYLDSTISLYANHSQANLTKSIIEESKGNTQAATESLKLSIKMAYSQEKENRLNKLGYPLDKDDLNWDRPMPKDPLGLEKFRWPSLPISVDESPVLEKEWDTFNEACSKEITDLESQLENLEEVWTMASQVRTKQVLEAGHKGQYASLFPPMANKAFIKLKYLVDDSDGHISYSYQRKTDAISAISDRVKELENILENQIKTLNQNYEEKFGEGKANPFDAACADYNKATNAFLSSANVPFEQAKNDYLNFLRRNLNDQIYYDQYTMWPEEFEMAKVIAKIKWLSVISGRGEFKDKNYYCQNREELKPGKFKLQEFDEVHCEYHSEIDLGIGTIASDCSTLSAKLDLKILKDILKVEILKLGWTLKQRDNDNATIIDQFERGSIEVGLKKGFGVGTGPLKAEAKLGGSGFVEIDRNGFSDAGLLLSADLKLGTNFVKPLDGINGIEVIGENGIKKAIDHTMGPGKDLSVTIVGIDAKISINAGFTAESKYLGKPSKDKNKK